MPKRMNYKISPPRKSYMARSVKDKNKRITKLSRTTIDKSKRKGQ